MIVLGVLFVSWLLFRGIGTAGVGALATWRDSGRCALAVMLLFTASAHFTSMRHDLTRMVPAWMPAPEVTVLVTGILEIAGALGILLRPTRRLAGICLCLLFLAMLPANVHAAQRELTIGGAPATPLAMRIPMQVLFIYLAWWSTRDPETATDDRTRKSVAARQG